MEFFAPSKLYIEKLKIVYYNQRMKFAVIGLGYVGSTIAVLLSRQHDVFVFDKNEERLNAIANRHSPIGDSLMEDLLQNEDLSLTASNNISDSISGADYIIIATDTKLDPEKGALDTTSIHQVLKAVTSSCSTAPYPTIIIRSTVPIGFTEALRDQYPEYEFLFCPEFLREKSAMEDVLNPMRVVIGYNGSSSNAKKCADGFGAATLECIDTKSAPVLYASTTEAEAIKLFSNSYLALRVSFFNELDTFASVKGLDSERIIKGVCLDSRIGDYYNVPGPGFGGHCLPKDTRQLIADFKSSDVPELLLQAALEENELRKEFVK